MDVMVYIKVRDTYTHTHTLTVISNHPANRKREICGTEREEKVFTHHTHAPRKPSAPFETNRRTSTMANKRYNKIVSFAYQFLGTVVMIVVGDRACASCVHFTYERRIKCVPASNPFTHEWHPSLSSFSLFFFLL